MSKPTFSDHVFHYFSLYLILAIGLATFVLFSYDRNLQLITAGLLSLSYTLWGVLHHLVHKDLYWSVAFEYLLISLLGFLTLFSILNLK